MLFPDEVHEVVIASASMFFSPPRVHDIGDSVSKTSKASSFLLRSLAHTDVMVLETSVTWARSSSLQ